MEDENKILDIKKEKTDILTKILEDNGYNSNSRLHKEELTEFLNKRSKNGVFEPKLKELLFSQIGIDDSKTISPGNFIENFVQLDDDLDNNYQCLENLKSQEMEEYQKIEELKNQMENDLINNRENNPQIEISIKDVDIEKKLEGIKNIYIKIINNDIEKDVNFIIGSNDSHKNEIIQITPKSKNDTIEFIIQGINDRNQMFHICNKLFRLQDISSDEKYGVEIEIPEIDDEEIIVAHIYAQIIFYWNIREAYEKQILKKEKRLNKLKKASEEAFNYSRKFKEIYGTDEEKENKCTIF